MGNMEFNGSFGCSEYEMAELRSLGQQGGHTASFLSRTSGEQTVRSSGICLIEYYGTKQWWEERPKKDGKYPSL